MTCLLAIDTATRYATVAVAVLDGSPVSADREVREVFSRSWFSQHNHGVELMTKINESLESTGLAISDITDIAIVNGPGSFSALRVGVATAQGIAMAAGLRVTPLPTLDVEIEQWADHDGPICAVVDAGSSGIAWGLYVPGPTGRRLEVTGVHAPSICVESCPDATVFCGEAVQQFTAAVPAARILSAQPPTRGADALIRVALRRLAAGEDRDPAEVEITYARAPTTTTPPGRAPDGSRVR